MSAGPGHPDAVLSFWFGDGDDDAAIARQQAALWWKKNADTDAYIREHFGALSEAAVTGRLDGWRDTPLGCLALIILVDQFRRNMFRGSAEAFSGDARARRWCLEGLARGTDESLRPIERVFFYLPLEHAEDPALQEHSVALFKKLVNSVADDQRETFEDFLDYARRHHDVIRRFGRFPHRNAILGRDTTPEETVFLQQPGSAF